METTQLQNLCPRCGQPRILVKKWKEKVKTYFGESTVIHEQTSCPNPKCQSAVDNDISVARAKKKEIEQNRLDRLDRIKTSRQITLGKRKK